MTSYFPCFPHFSNTSKQSSNKAQSKPENRSNYIPIHNQKNLNTFSLFKGFLKGSFKEEEQGLYPALSTFNYFKNISEVVYDKNRQVVSAYLENDPIWASTSWSDIVGNLGPQVFEDKKIECAQMIETFGSSMEELNKLSETLQASAIKSDFGIKKQDFDEMRSELEKKYPCFYIKNVMKRFNPTILEYNTAFLKLLDYDPSSFASNILRHGVPEIYPNMQKKYAHMVKKIISILIQGSHDGKPLEMDCRLLHANLKVSCVIEKVYLMRSFNKDNELEIEILSVYENTGEPIKIEEEAAKMPFLPHAVSTAMEIEREEFLTKFYNIRKRDERDAARTCKIRYL